MSTHLLNVDFSRQSQWAQIVEVTNGEIVVCIEHRIHSRRLDAQHLLARLKPQLLEFLACPNEIIEAIWALQCNRLSAIYQQEDNEDPQTSSLGRPLIMSQVASLLLLLTLSPSDFILSLNSMGTCSSVTCNYRMVTSEYESRPSNDLNA